MTKEPLQPFVLPGLKQRRLSPHELYLAASKEEQDAAKRISEQYALHMAAALRDPVSVMGWYFTVSLADGSPGTGGIYPTKKAAAAAMKGRSRDYIYPCLGPGSMPPHDALAFLRFFRKAKAEGWPIADPDNVRNRAPKQRKMW